LKSETLAATGGDQREHILARLSRIDDLQLVLSEGCVPEDRLVRQVYLLVPRVRLLPQRVRLWDIALILLAE
jgi:hypothetical protein